MKDLATNIEQYRPAIALTSYISRRILSWIRNITFGLVVVFSLATAASYLLLNENLFEFCLGISLLTFAFWLEQILAYCYHNSYYYKGLNSIIGLDDVDISGATYEVAETVLNNKFDITLAFCNSTFGNSTLIRSGISPETINTFLRSNRTPVSANTITLPENEIFSLIGLGKYLLRHDMEFKNLIKTNGVREETFIGALRWVVGTYHQDKRRQRWWGKDSLSKTTGIGKDWTYGRAYHLEKYSRNITTSAVFSTLGSDASYAAETIIKIESALARNRNTNVLLIGETGIGKMDLILEVQKRMRDGVSLDAISGKEMLVLDTERLFASHQDKQSLENTILSLFNEAANAGNLILVIENLSVFVREAEAMGIFIPELLDTYLAHPELQFITTDTPEAYHNHLEHLGTFARRFAEILIDTPNLSATIGVLQNIALGVEYKLNTLFTFNSIEAIAAAADRYIVEGIMPDKAIELLSEVASQAQQTNTALITEDFVYTYVGQKTGIPLGPVQDSERDQLLNLEDRLHEQVIGQDRAVNAIARTMRRARAGIQTADRPIGSFLFLGPTGVGKTETAKALAKVFFGSEDNLRRLDMSEFSGDDALLRLLGDGQSSGTLPDMLREHPYCVLLLDEFEKGSESVHDLFLQILDEGVFTDARGAKVNARNTIIIATSNAGSKLIIKTVQQRKDISVLDQEIISYIIENGIYKPELINRFDSTILFEPLDVSEQTQVADLMLKELYGRLRKRGYNVRVSPELMHKLVKKGYDPEFGARPMQRVLQNVIEEKIAQKIIGGEMQKGNEIELTGTDFTEAELAV